MLMPIAIIISVNATGTYLWRLRKIQQAGGEAYDDYQGIRLMTTLLLLALFAYFFVSAAAAANDDEL